MIRLENRSAKEVAQLLHEHEIGSAVINACVSAKASLGIKANLSRVFVRNGVSNVFAMSHKVSSKAVSSSLITFYNSLLSENRSFSESAAMARKELRINANCTGGEVGSQDIEDWFVPVFYSDGTDIQIQLPSSTPIETSRFHLILSWVLCYPALGLNPQVERGRTDRPLSSPHADVEIQPPLSLSNDIITLENGLLEYRTVIWNVHPGPRRLVMINKLVRLWRVTGWVTEVRFINACQFSEDCKEGNSNAIEMLAEGRHTVREQPPMTTSVQACSSVMAPKLLIIIWEFDNLFPYVPNGDVNEYVKASQARFWDSLGRLPQKLDDGTYPPSRPYLIIISNHPIDRLRDIFTDFNSDWGHLIYNRNSILRQSHAIDGQSIV